MTVIQMTRPWRHPKSGVYYFRRAIPKALRPLAGGHHEYKRSLHTKEAGAAKRLYADAAAICDDQFSQLRATLASSPAPALLKPSDDPEALPQHHDTIGRGALRALAAELGAEILAGHWNDPAPDHAFDLKHSFPEGPWGTPNDPWAGRRFVIIKGKRASRRASEQTFVADPARDFLTRRGITLSAAEWEAFCQLAAPQIDDALAGLQRRWRGEESGTSLATVAGKITFSPPRAPKVSFEELLEGWRRERKPKLATVETYRSHVAEFARFVEHDDASRVTPEDVLRWKDHLLEGGNLSAKTINEKRLAALKSVFGWGKDNRKLSSNPAQGVSVKSKAPARTRSKGFTDKEAQTILRAALEASTTKSGALSPKNLAARRWVPWLCCYSGARVAEIAQLRKADLKQEAGVWVIVLTPEAGSIKSNVYRRVPLHSHLIELGFLKFVSRAPAGPLFFDPARGRKENPRKPPAQTVANKLAKWVREIGVTDRRVAPNHGWRHRFATECRRHGVSEGAEMALKGHAPKTVGQSYGDWPVEVLAQELAKMPMVKLTEAR